MPCCARVIIEDRDELGQMGFKLPKRLPKGFVCNCDLAAYMLIDKLTERGYKVPEDVSVVGFNNYLYPELADREITTYEVNTKAMTKVALEKVLKQIKNPKRGCASASTFLLLPGDGISLGMYSRQFCL